VDTVMDCLRAFGDMIPAIEANRESMYEAARRGFSTATDLADYLVGKGIAFRDSHEIVGKSVAFGIEQNKDLSEMTLAELQQFSDQIDEDVFEVLTLEGSVAARNHLGGTAPEQVRAAASRALQGIKSRS
jgi:argininosuccinate lyase